MRLDGGGGGGGVGRGGLGGGVDFNEMWCEEDEWEAWGGGGERGVGEEGGKGEGKREK